MSDYSFADQISLFYNANEIIGLQELLLQNNFCNKNTKIIQLRPNTAGDIIKI